MARKNKVVDEVVGVDAGDLLASAVVTDENPNLSTDENPPLKKGSQDWTRYILSKLEDDEVYDGRPKIDGLRRLAEEYIGEIISSIPQVTQSPHFGNSNHACVQYYITFKCFNGTVKVYGGAADVFKGNGDDELFSWRHSTATCETRAEARALRKALRLAGVVADEEVSQLPIEDSGVGNLLSESQLVCLDNMCKRHKINPYKFAEKADLYDLTYTEAVALIAKLNGMQQGLIKIPESIVGYVPVVKKERK